MEEVSMAVLLVMLSGMMLFGMMFGMMLEFIVERVFGECNVGDVVREGVGRTLF
jgi:hypothetical protein